MGVDKPNIRTVFHIQPVPSPEEYLQEAGRAGRDGARARAIVLVPSQAAMPEASCRRAALLATFGEPTPVCSGCDVCRGQDRGPPVDAGPALGRLAPLVHRVDAQEARSFLLGRVPPDLWESDLPHRAGWGLWAEEDDLTAAELWNGLVAGGWVRFHPRGWWKGLLAPVDRSPSVDIRGSPP